MFKFIGKKTLIIALSILVVGAMTAVGIILATGGDTTTASTANNGAVVPILSDPEAVFFHNTTGSVTVSYGELYEEFKINDGVNQLLFMVDTILLASDLAAVTAEEMTEKAKYLTYGLTDDAEIAELSQEDREQYESTYAQNMVLLGYAGNEEDYIRMVCAKENFVTAMMLDETYADKAWFIDEDAVAKYYETSYFVDAKAIKIKFLSLTDAEAVLRSFNLVSYHGELRLYTGIKPIDQVSSASFDDDNTAVLTDAEILDYYILMYNYVYGGYRDLLDEDATAEELKALPEMNHVYTDVKAAQAGLATFLFSTLDSYDSYLLDPANNSWFTYEPVRYAGASDTAYYMILKLTDTAKVDLEDFAAATDDLATMIGQDVYDEIEAEIVKMQLATSSFVSNRIAEIRAEHGFIVKDYYLGVDYQSIYTSYELDEEGSSSVVAVFDDEEITADELLAFAMNKNGGLYALYAAQFAFVFDMHFADVYCTEGETCETDLETNDSEKLAEHETTLATLKTNFEKSSYASLYTFAEYLYLAYGAKSEADMINKYYIKSTLQPYAVYDRIIADDWDLLRTYLYDLVQEYFDNYFSLDVKTLQIFVDRDEDGAADDYEKFVDGLADEAAYNTLLSDFEAAIRTYMDEDDTRTFANLISAFNKAKRTDAIWGDFKAFGFMLATKNLSSSASLTYLTTIDSYEQAMIDGFIAAYAEYNLPENVDKDELYYSELVASVDGTYLLYCEKGSDFEKPTAQFTMTYETDGVTPKYTVGTENANDMPSIAQLQLYCEFRFYEIVYGTGTDVEETYGITKPVIPTSVKTAIEAYFTDLHDSMYVVGFLNILIADQLQLGTFDGAFPGYAVDDAAIKAAVAAIADVYFTQVFDQYDTNE